MAEAEPTKTTKRRLRAPAPSVRENAVKAQANADKPPKNRHLRTAGTTAGKPFRRLGKALNRKPVRFLGRIFAPKFARNAFYELRLVSWPSRRETFRLTFAVLAFAIIFSVIIGTVDYGLDKLFRAVLLK